MRDPREGVAPDGTIVTGVARGRVPQAFESALGLAVQKFGGGSLYLYGSVATGQARVGFSDLDLLSVGLDAKSAAGLAAELSGRLAKLVRGVEIAVTAAGDFAGESDQAYGDRVFLRHYCVLLAGEDVGAGWAAFAADARAARGFNGDVRRHVERWRGAIGAGECGGLGRRIGRKTLLALAGVVSVHDGIWTTDRRTAAERWAEVRPELAGGLGQLLRLSESDQDLSPRVLAGLMDDVVEPLVGDFRAVVGLWADKPVAAGGQGEDSGAQ